MATTRKLGIGDIPLRGGEHVCACSTGQGELDELMFGFVRAGLWSGDYCVIVADDVSANRLLTVLDRDLTASPGRLRIDTADRAVLDLAEVDRSDSFRSWDAIVDDARGDGHPFVRLGVMPAGGSPGPLGLRSLVRYEAELHSWTEAHADTATVCWYDMRRFDADVVNDLVALHHEVVVDGQVRDHPIDHGDLATRFSALSALDACRCCSIEPGHELGPDDGTTRPGS